MKKQKKGLAYGFKTRWQGDVEVLDGAQTIQARLNRGIGGVPSDTDEEVVPDGTPLAEAIEIGDSLADLLLENTIDYGWVVDP